MLERRRLHVSTERGDAFARLLPWELFNMLPSAERLYDGDFRIVQRGRDLMLDAAAPRTNPGVDRPISARVVHGMCEQGASLVLNFVENHVPGVAALVAMVERHFCAPVSANCYASFRRESALPPHLDYHDVLVLQLHGSKRWFCHGQPFRWPVRGRSFKMIEDAGPVEAEILMAPGDCLFLPRGEVHWAEVDDTASMHLTLAIQPPRGRNLFGWLGGLAEAEEIARQDLNRLEGPEAQAARQAALKAMLRHFADTLDLDAFYASADRMREPIQPFNLGHLHALQPDMLVLAALRRWVALPEDGKLTLAGETVALTPQERAVLALLLERDGWTVEALEAALSGDETRQAISGLARKSLVFLFPA